MLLKNELCAVNTPTHVSKPELSQTNWIPDLPTYDQSNLHCRLRVAINNEIDFRTEPMENDPKGNTIESAVWIRIGIWKALYL